MRAYLVQRAGIVLLATDGVSGKEVVEWVGVQRSVIEAVAVCGPGCADVLD